jgi:hypothetical protein
VIVTAHHVRDRHVDVVGDDRQVIRRVAVGPKRDEVFDVRVVEGDVAVHEVVKCRLAGRYLEADGARHPRGLTSGYLIRRQLRAAAVVRP